MSTGRSNTEQPAPAAATDYRQPVTGSLLANVLATFAKHGIQCADGEPVRLARALTGYRVADGLAGPPP